jgi:hypothetical protein
MLTLPPPSEDAGVANHEALGGRAEEKWSRRRWWELTFQRLWEANANGLVEVLYLKGSNVGDHGGRAIGEALALNTTLTQLELRHNLVGDER